MAITWPEIRNFPVLQDPATANPPDVGNGGSIYAGNESALVSGVADGNNAYYGPVAGKYLWGRPGIDPTLIQQAMQIAGQQIQRWAGNPGAVLQWERDLEAGKYGVDTSNTMPWNWGATTSWFPLGPSGSFEAPLGQYGLPNTGNQPWFMLSAGYQVVGVSDPHVVNGYPFVTVTYQRTGNVPLPNQGSAPQYDPHALPWFDDMAYHMSHDVPDQPSAAQSAANIASIPALAQNFPGSTLFVPASGVPSTMVPAAGTAVVPMPPVSILPSGGGAGSPVSMFSDLLAPLTGGGSSAGGGLGAYMPLLLIAAVAYLVMKK